MAEDWTGKQSAPATVYQGHILSTVAPRTKRGCLREQIGFTNKKELSPPAQCPCVAVCKQCYCFRAIVTANVFVHSSSSPRTRASPLHLPSLLTILPSAHNTPKHRGESAKLSPPDLQKPNFQQQPHFEPRCVNGSTVRHHVRLRTRATANTTQTIG